MRNPLAAHPPWRQLVIISVILPAIIVLAVLAFAWPAARIAPRDLPVGIVGTTPSSQQGVDVLTRAEPGGFDFHLYATAASARAAIEDRDVYGAYVITDRDVTVMEASAASPTVAELLSTVAQQLAEHAPDAAPGTQLVVDTIDVVPTSSDDPHGSVLSSALLPLTICSIIIAAAVGILLAFRPAARQMVALAVVSGVAGLGTYLIAQGFLGALPHEHVATWAVLSLTLLAISATTAGLIAIVGSAGLALGAVLMVFVGNPFSGVTSAPQLLPGWVDSLGQWLPPGAGTNLLRSTAYFDGNGAAAHLTVLILWTVFGLTAIAIGNHTSIGFAANPVNKRLPRPHDAERTAGAHEASEDLSRIHPEGLVRQSQARQSQSRT